MTKLNDDSYCGACLFWQSTNEDLSTGLCRRMAPRVFFVKEDQKSLETMWPVTYGDDWCGEYEPKEAA